MNRVLTITILVATAFCRNDASGILQDLQLIYHHGNVTAASCSGTKVLLSNINFTLYTQKNQQNGVALTVINYNAVNPIIRLIFIIHGWLESGTTGWVLQMKDTYLNTVDANVIVVDWSQYAGINYGAAFCAVPLVGGFLADLIYHLTNNTGFNLNETDLIGFSMGAQVAGYAGQGLFGLTDSKVGRIVGLEAAGPLYQGLPTNQRLDASDAFFVQAIHTNNGQFGYGLPYATVDFELNYFLPLGCGTIQPGCPLHPGVPITTNTEATALLPYIFCNHLRAAAYFIESIVSKDFVGASCKCGALWEGSCKSGSTTIMGEKCPVTAMGLRVLNTNSKAPFAKGNAGIPRHRLF